MAEFSVVVGIALRRVSQGRVTKLGGHWLDGGRPVPCFLPAALESVIEAGWVRLADPEPDHAGQRRARLTDAGAARYAVDTSERPPNRERRRMCAPPAGFEPTPPVLPTPTVF